MGLEMLSLCLLLAPAVLGWKQDCLNDNKPVGFGAQVTGGAGGKQVTPKNIDELKSYLQSKDKLIIVLDKEYDFTDSEGRATQTGCFFQKCGSGFQESLAHAGTCNGRPPTKVSFSKAGVTELVISSDKTIMGKGSIKGKGLRIQNAKNVIIRDITIHDINPQVIWAGDALAFYNAQNVWVHKVTFRNIGRQHLVSYQYANTGITVSSCFFDGTTKSSAYCDDHHFWMWLFWGTNDQITLINNRILNSAGRLPHAGGWGGAKSYIHLVGNEFQSNAHVGLEPYKGAIILSEGNKFINFKYPINPNAKGGALAMIDSAADAAQCEKYFGQTCKINTYSKSPIEKRLDGSVLAAFSKLDKTAVNGARAAACGDKLASSSEPTGKQSSKLKPHKKLASSSEPTGKQSSKLKPHKKLSSSSKPTGKRSSKRKQHKKLASSSKPTGKRSSKRKAHKKTG